MCVGIITLMHHTTYYASRTGLSNSITEMMQTHCPRKNAA